MHCTKYLTKDTASKSFRIKSFCVAVLTLISVIMKRIGWCNFCSISFQTNTACHSVATSIFHAARIFNIMPIISTVGRMFYRFSDNDKEGISMIASKFPSNGLLVKGLHRVLMVPGWRSSWRLTIRRKAISVNWHLCSRSCYLQIQTDKSSFVVRRLYRINLTRDDKPFDIDRVLCKQTH